MVKCFILADRRQTGQITGLLAYELILLRVFQRARLFLLPIFLLRLDFAIRAPIKNKIFNNL